MRGLSLEIRFRADCFCGKCIARMKAKRTPARKSRGFGPGHLLNWTRYCMLVTSAAGRVAKSVSTGSVSDKLPTSGHYRKLACLPLGRIPTRRSEPTPPPSSCGKLSCPVLVDCPCIRGMFGFARRRPVVPSPGTRAVTRTAWAPAPVPPPLPWTSRSAASCRRYARSSGLRGR